MAEPWRNVETIALRRSGKWLLGALVQETGSSENPAGFSPQVSRNKRRVKIFKGVITPKGKLEILYKGEVYRISLVQRLNIPNLDYWFRMNRMMTPIMQKYFAKKGQKILQQYADKDV